ncbi:MAG: succinate dehydrogenase, cytochrome b556 subunit [Candidatus Electryonea clarkiae]|nr:succinate dehydrogenase, cytochrome b556 subunit [Candidatus Electryonea clarkiae]MDP8287184.1 succinate dehydrogenase, cytochrome b556 subunit [Candidatus Electryonea clarkiae]
MHYRWQTGMSAWVLHRVTGLALVFYIMLHIWVISSLQLGPKAFEATMGFVSAPLFRFLEVGLLFCVIYHSLNGIRLVMIDFFGATEKHVSIFYILMSIGAITWVWGGSMMISHALHDLGNGVSFFPF